MAPPPPRAATASAAAPGQGWERVRGRVQGITRGACIQPVLRRPQAPAVVPAVIRPAVSHLTHLIGRVQREREAAPRRVHRQLLQRRALRAHGGEGDARARQAKQARVRQAAQRTEHGSIVFERLYTTTRGKGDAQYARWGDVAR